MKDACCERRAFFAGLTIPGTNGHESKFEHLQITDADNLQAQFHRDVDEVLVPLVTLLKCCLEIKELEEIVKEFVLAELITAGMSFSRYAFQGFDL